MLKAYIFKGGEGVTEHNSFDMTDWSKESAIEAIVEYKGNYWPTQDCSEMFAVTDPEIKVLADTIEFIGANLIQAVDDEEDGGQIYIVRA